VANSSIRGASAGRILCCPPGGAPGIHTGNERSRDDGDKKSISYGFQQCLLFLCLMRLRVGGKQTSSLPVTSHARLSWNGHCVNHVPTRGSDAVDCAVCDAPLTILCRRSSTSSKVSATRASACRGVHTSNATLGLSGAGSTVGPTSIVMKGGQLAVWVRSTRTPGAVALTASGMGLAQASVYLTSQAVPGLPSVARREMTAAQC